MRIRNIYRLIISVPRYSVHVFIRIYQLTLSGIIGRTCRHMPSCSHYTDEAVLKYGFWAGGWMGFARICRCNPWGTEGVDFIPHKIPDRAHWYLPWRYARWRGTNKCTTNELLEKSNFSCIPCVPPNAGNK